MILMQQGKIPIPCNRAEPARGALCPTMDLIAFAGGGVPQVITFRSIDWEKISAATCSGSSGALAWRPDGKELAVGTVSGDIVLVKTETGQERELTEEPVRHGNPITRLYWTADRVRTRISETKNPATFAGVEDDDSANGNEQASDDESDIESYEDEDRVARLFLRPPELRSEGDSLVVTNDRAGDDNDNEDEDIRILAGTRCDHSLLGGTTLDILVAGDCAGVVSLSAYGQFVVAVLDLADCFDRTADTQEESVHVSHAFLSNDFRILVVVLRLFHPDTSMDEYRVCTVSTEMLGTYKKHIALIASEFSSIAADLAGLKQTVNQAAKIWETGVIVQLRKLLTSLLDEEEEMMQNIGYTMDRRQVLNQVLFDLLVRGIYKASLVKFFTRTNDSHLVRLQRFLDTACDSVVLLMESSALRCVEGLVFRLGGLLGKARSEPQVFTGLGIDPDFLLPFGRSAEDLLLAVRRVSSLARLAKQNLGAFQRWISGCRRRWPEAPQTAPTGLNDGGFGVGFTKEDSRRVEHMLVESDLEHVVLSLELGLEKYKLFPPKAAVASWDRDFAEPANEDETLSEELRERRTGGLAGQISTFEQAWITAGPRIREAITNSCGSIESRELVQWPCERYRGENDTKIALGGGADDLDRGRCDLAFVDPSLPNTVSLSSMTPASTSWQPRCNDFVVEQLLDITHLEFCTGTPGRKSSLEHSLLSITGIDPVADQKLIMLGWSEEYKQLMMLKERVLGGEHSQTMKNIVGLASSGPRGVACVITTNRKFELYDIVHDEEEVSNVFDSAIQGEEAAAEETSDQL